MTDSRFNEYGDANDGSGRHVTEFENTDLTPAELRLKLQALEEDGDMEAEAQRVAEMLAAHEILGNRTAPERFAVLKAKGTADLAFLTDYLKNLNPENPNWGDVADLNRLTFVLGEVRGSIEHGEVV